ncbi:DEAD/DEAH box helicase [Corynebacterium callunae]|uniref:DEAD/DEAH box helicase n=1 Tax=Corynebacterium callunae TaxID=1721 RepID=UPI001FFF4A03|nr:DEAD/DEAH box helicase [Corynebacterium callunae]MCK2200799.1 DEAD/DEAH box helicase [Corynebacterium callunae]
MSTITDAVSALRTLPSQSAQGLAFEKLMVNFIKSDPTLSTEFDEVHRWVDWPYNGGTMDTGIDLVAYNKDDDAYTAIQCKFYLPTTSLAKGQLDSFFEASGRTFETPEGTRSFSNRLVISTTDKWSSNAEKMLENQTIPTNRIGLSAIAESPIDWDIAYPGSELTINLQLKEPYSPRPHQQTAIEKAIEGFQTHDRGKLIMACGTGKTFTALRLSEEVARFNGNKARILFLVPSISLLSQTLKEWTAQKTMDLRPVAVCSDSKVSKAAEDIAAYDLEVPVSTDGALIAEKLEHRKRAAGLTVVFSTYQSLPAVHAAQEAGAEPFDLVICDEAHRTTGITLAGEDPSNFTRIHDASYIKAAKRLYMTATPRLFDDSVKGKAADHSAEVSSMDDEAIYGPEFHRLGFGEAVEKGLLTDYKVVVMTVDEQVAANALTVLGSTPGEELTLDMTSAIIGAWNGLAKRSGKEQDTKTGFSSSDAAMERAVAFARDIKTSQQIAESFPRVVNAYTTELEVKNDEVDEHNLNLSVACQHVDGSMNALERNSRLTWLKAPTQSMETKILTNARCLSEGVDVPALDSVIFFNPRNSMVDVVQSVGRVMRKSPGKNYGYIILPVAVPPGVAPSAALNDSRRFKVVWQVLNALRAHDDRFNAMVNSIALNEGNIKDLPVETEHTGPTSKDIDNAPYDSAESATQYVLFSLEQWQEAIYTKLVDKVGTRTYWEDWADDVADIAQAQITRIKALLDNASPTIKEEFERFVEGLRGNLNESISDDEAISMLSQHLITAPVFDALFAESSFAKQNPVSQVMQRMADALNSAELNSETEKLEKFYDSVRIRAAEVSSAAGKQAVIKDLYERFFKKAFKKQSEALGIVYTPVEIVDFILRAADDVSKKHFGRGLSDKDVHVLDPFTGTGTFMVRLLQSGLIKPEDLARKYANELHATEIMLLAYYVAAVNIETTYFGLEAERALRNGEDAPVYEPFDGIVLGDTFQMYEDDDKLDLEVFTANNDRMERQKLTPVQVIVGNPPYSGGQSSANDNNANLKYPTLDHRIEDTFAKRSTAQLKNSLYDSYLRAFRWATDRIKTQGVVAFVSNGGWIDGNTADGVRLSLAEDFSEIYVFNLRGNQRTAGEQSRKEGGKVFGSGSRNTVAIFIGVKRADSTDCTIFYRDIGDYLSAEKKLEIVSRADIGTIEWQSITPNKHGDWANQRSADFETWPVLGSKTALSIPLVFKSYSNGVGTARDSWNYNFNQSTLVSNNNKIVERFTDAVALYEKNADLKISEFLNKNPQLLDDKNIKWSSGLQSHLRRGTKIKVIAGDFRISSYRPFQKQHSYFGDELNDRRGHLPTMFPTSKHDNIGLIIAAPAERAQYSIFATDALIDLNFYAVPGQLFSRWTWEPIETREGEIDFGNTLFLATPDKGVEGEILDGYRRVDNITDEILKLYQSSIGAEVSKGNIFYFVYAQLHDPSYREAYATDLKKMLPHIETPTDRARFDQLVDAGKKLMDLHINYEDVEPWPVEVKVKEKADPTDRETWRVTKMKWAKVRDPETKKLVEDRTTLIYNSSVTISGIPEEAENYQLGSRSAIAWLIDRYQVKTDKASGIVNDPNDWADEVGNPKYIVELIAKVTRVAVETMRIVEDL